MSSVVAVAVSGGVDSSVAMHLLHEAGYRVVGVSHVIWPAGSPVRRRTLERARAVCDELGVSHLVVDMERTFAREVVHHFVDAYRHGQTPNPCIRCNERMRFTAFFSRAESLLHENGLLLAGESFLFATGHYARVGAVNGMLRLRRARDAGKDQTYMLSRVPPDMLPHVCFPLGGLLKREVVALAVERGLPSASLRESQDVCFADRNYTEELRNTLGSAIDVPGPLVDTAGRRLGTHRGYMHYTIGQRRGLGLGNGPWYVRRIDPQENLVVVCREHELGVDGLFVEDVRWMGPQPRGVLSCTVQLRYQSTEIPCTVEPVDGGGCVIRLERRATVTPGQAAVFYEGEYVRGSGTIARELLGGPMAPG